MPQRDVGPLTLEAVPSAVRTLSRAFAFDPFFARVFPDPTTREAAVLWYFEATTRACIALGGADAMMNLDGPTGVALWIPTNGEIVPEIVRASNLDRRADVFGRDAEARYQSLVGPFGDLHRLTMPDAHRYLTILGVDPDHQGRGVGGAVLAPGLAAADRDGIACYTETTLDRNVPFYERHGFTVVESGIVDSVPFWTFRREPHVVPGLTESA